MRLEEICDRIDYLEGLKDDIESELEELYEERQELWEAERRAALDEYARSVMP